MAKAKTTETKEKAPPKSVSVQIKNGPEFGEGKRIDALRMKMDPIPSRGAFVRACFLLGLLAKEGVAVTMATGRPAKARRA